MTPRGFLPASGRFVTHPSAHADAPRVMRSTILYVGWASRAEARRCQSYSSRRGDVAAAGARNKRLPLPHRRIIARATWVTGATTTAHRRPCRAPAPSPARSPPRHGVTPRYRLQRTRRSAAAARCFDGHRAFALGGDVAPRPARGHLATTARLFSAASVRIGVGAASRSFSRAVNGVELAR